MHLMTQVFGKLRQFVPCIVAAAIGIAVTGSATAVIVQRDDNDVERNSACSPKIISRSCKMASTNM